MRIIIDGEDKTFDTSGLAKLPAGHTAGVINLVGVGADGSTPVFVPTSSVWQGFIAYRATSNQALPQSATTALIFNAEERDELGMYDPTTGYFRPNKTGLWRITALGAFSSTTGNPAGAGNYYDLRLRKVSDSSVVAVLCGGRTVSILFGSTLGSPGSAIVSLTAGTDYNLVFNNGDTKEWSLFASQTVSRFSAEFVSE